MAFVTKKYALDTMRTNDIKYWKLYAEDNSCIGEMQSAEVDTDESLSLLSEALNEVSDGWVVIKANIKKGKDLSLGGDTQSGSYKFKVSMSGNRDRNNNRNGNNNNGGGGGGGESILKKMYDLQLEFEKHKLKTEHERELEKLKVKSDPNDKFLERIGNILEMEYLHERGLKKSAAIGDGETKTEKKKTTAAANTSATEKEKVLEAIGELNEVDESVGTSLLKLAKFAKENPDKYKQYLEMLG